MTTPAQPPDTAQVKERVIEVLHDYSRDLTLSRNMTVSDNKAADAIMALLVKEKL